MIARGRYTSGGIAVGNLRATIASLELRRVGDATFDDLATLARLLFVRGDLLARIVDHDRAELVADEAVAAAPDSAEAFALRAHVAQRFHRFAEAAALVERARGAGLPRRELDVLNATQRQATGRFEEACALRQRLATDAPGIATLGALASLLADLGAWEAAAGVYRDALRADDGASPLPCGQLLFEWGVNAMRHGDLDGAEEVLAELDALLPAHVPGRVHRAELALAHGEVALAAELITPVVDASDDPEVRATYAEVLAARGERQAAAREAQRAAAAYERLLARRPEAYADHAAAFYTGIGDRPDRAVELATANWRLRDTPRARRLLANALRRVQRVA